MADQTKRKSGWRTPSKENPEIGFRHIAYIVAGIVALLAAVIVPFVIKSQSGLSLAWSFVVFWGAFCLLPELIWIVLFLFKVPVQIRSSNKLWRERMASGFYKTLPPVKDDDD